MFKRHGYTMEEELMMLDDEELRLLGVHLDAHRKRIQLMAKLAWERRLAESTCPSKQVTLGQAIMVATLAVIIPAVASPGDVGRAVRRIALVGTILVWHYGKDGLGAAQRWLGKLHNDEAGAQRAARASESRGVRQPSVAGDEGQLEMEEDLIDSQERKVEELKGKLQEEGLEIPRGMKIGDNEKAVLVRFLRAREWRVENALAMLEETINWREERGGDQKMIEHEPSEEEKQLCLSRYELGFYSFDKEGRPVTLEHVGKSDLPGLAKEIGGIDTLVDFHVRYMELASRVMMEHSSRRRGVVSDKMCLILDLEGATSRLASRENMDILRRVSYIDQHYYPARPICIFRV